MVVFQNLIVESPELLAKILSERYNKDNAVLLWAINVLLVVINNALDSKLYFKILFNLIYPNILKILIIYTFFE